MNITPEDIYRYFILDDVLKLPDFRFAKNQAQVNAYKYVYIPPTLPRRGSALVCKYKISK